MSETKASTESTQRLAVSFLVGEAWCGLDAEPVQEIVRPGHITPVHQAPAYVLGVMNLRGRIVTLIDLGAKLKLGHTQLNDDSRILIVDSGSEPVGLLIKSDRGTVNVDLADLRSPPENVSGVQRAMLMGVCLVELHLLAMLKLDAVLSADDALVAAGRQERNSH